MLVLLLLIVATIQVLQVLWVSRGAVVLLRLQLLCCGVVGIAFSGKPQETFLGLLIFVNITVHLLLLMIRVIHQHLLGSLIVIGSRSFQIMRVVNLRCLAHKVMREAILRAIAVILFRSSLVSKLRPLTSIHGCETLS